MAARRDAAAYARGGRVALGWDGNRLELLVGGISYSSYDPDDPWTGYVWDAMAAVALLAQRPKPSVLLLGCAAGTTLMLLRRLVPRARLTALDLDADVLALARAKFDLDAAGAEVIAADGPAFLARTRRRFDVILDDMYAPDGDGVRRPVADERAHLELVASRLTPGGIAATNATTDDDPPGLQEALRRAYRQVFRHRVRLGPRLGYNVVLAGSTRRSDSGRLRQVAAELPPDERAGLLAIRVRRF
jgi:spermidine synthase